MCIISHYLQGIDKPCLKHDLFLTHRFSGVFSSDPQGLILYITDRDNVLFVWYSSDVTQTVNPLMSVIADYGYRGVMKTTAFLYLLPIRRTVGFICDTGCPYRNKRVALPALRLTKTLQTHLKNMSFKHLNKQYNNPYLLRVIGAISYINYHYLKKSQPSLYIINPLTPSWPAAKYMWNW